MEEELRNLFETIELGVLYQDRSGRTILANPAAEKILGLTLGQMQQVSPAVHGWQAIHEDGSAFAEGQHPAATAFSTGQPVRDALMGVRHPVTGNYSWILANIIPVFRHGEDKPSGVFSTFEEITDLKNAHDNLLASEDRFQKVFTEGPMAMAIVGSDFRFITTNQLFRDLTGYTTAELEKITFREITHPEHLEQDIDAVQKVLFGSIPRYCTEKRYIRKDGSTQWASLTLLAIHDRAGHFLHFLAILAKLPDR